MFVLRTGIGSRDLPSGLEASSLTVRRRRREWNDIDLWKQIYRKLLSEMHASHRVDFAEVLIDGGLIKAQP